MLYDFSKMRLQNAPTFRICVAVIQEKCLLSNAELIFLATRQLETRALSFRLGRRHSHEKRARRFVRRIAQTLR